ncbi:MAG: hypothetical protein ACOYN8_00745 [Pseudanabaena sp.]|jgi:hypothetical protein
MALKIGRIEIGLRLLLSFVAIAIAYGYLGSYLSVLFKADNYLTASLWLILAIAGVFAIPQSVGGLLAAIAAIAIVCWQASLTSGLITFGVCLFLYWLGFQDVRYNAAPDKKLSIIEIFATVVTIALSAAVSVSLFQIPIQWLASLAIGVFAAAITLIGKQIKYLELPLGTNFVIMGILSGLSLIIGFALKAIFFSPLILDSF